jgi:excinuclease ABC subunit A
LADWIIELGPEGGDGGGELVFAGDVATFEEGNETPTQQVFGG